MQLQATLIIGLLAGGGQTRFDHSAHFEKVPGTQACGACHLAIDTADRDRPATQSHNSCSASGCHATTFYGGSAEARETLCTVCHVAGSVGADMSALHPFPRPDGARDSCVAFSHQAHLAKDRMGPEGCQNCHAIDDAKGTVAVISHDTCAGCHSEAKGTNPSMGECAGCHAVVPAGPTGAVCSPWKRGWRPIIFPHGPHRQDARNPGKVLNCAVCHVSVHQTEKVQDIELLQKGKVMNGVCSDCHVRRFAQKMPDGRTAFSLNKCGGCHRTKEKRFLPSTGMPEGHGR